MDDNSRPPISQSRRWWCLWLLATVILPAAAGAIFSFMPRGAWSEIYQVFVALVILALHLITSAKLDERIPSWITGLLILGGWILIPMSFFFGCAAFVGGGGHSR